MKQRFALPGIWIILGATWLLGNNVVRAYGQQQIPVVHGQNQLPLPRPSPSASGVETPGGNELILPQVSPEFVGRWGGHLYSLSQESGSKPQPISFIFGQKRDGTVYFSSSIWGNPNLRDTRASAQVVTPRKVKITEEHLADDGSRSLRVVQKDNLLLKNSKIIDCLESVQIFDITNGEPAYGVVVRPYYSSAFHGSLHILNESDENALSEEVLDRGSVQHGDVEGSAKFGN